MSGVSKAARRCLALPLAGGSEDSALRGLSLPAMQRLTLNSRQPAIHVVKHRLNAGAGGVRAGGGRLPAEKSKPALLQLGELYRGDAGRDQEQVLLATVEAAAEGVEPDDEVIRSLRKKRLQIPGFLGAVLTS